MRFTSRAQAGLLAYLTPYLIPTITCIGGLAFFHITFGRFFSMDGMIGHDYALALPALLDNYYWYLNNGLASPPWFSPGFCGGIPVFSDPQSTYFSVFQILTFITDPLRATYISIMLYAGLGCLGMYLFLRQILAISPESSALGAMLWLLNGFYSHRMIVGHLGFIGVALIPLVAWILIRKQDRMSGHFLSVVCASLLIASWVHSGLGTLLIPSALAVLGMFCIATIQGVSLGATYAKSFAAGIIAIGLSASKLTAAFSTMTQFPRSQYPLSGFGSIVDLLIAMSSAILLPSELTQEIAWPKVVNAFTYLPAHEWAFTLTPLPIALIMAGAVIWLYRSRKNVSHLISYPITIGESVHILMLLVVLAIPLAIQYHSPEWNAILKQTPILKSTSAPWRWMIIWLPIICMAAAISADYLLRNDKARTQATVAAIAFLGVWVWFEPRSYYEHQGYDPKPIVAAYRTANDASFRPRIEFIGHIQDNKGNVVVSANRNDLVTNRISQAYCYNPLFGYGLENLDLTNIGPGPVLDENNGSLNIKNPACYTFPEANACKPGDVFKAAQIKEAEKFVSYRKWDFRRSTSQDIADMITAISVAVVSVVAVLAAIGLLRRQPSRAIKDR